MLCRSFEFDVVHLSTGVGFLCDTQKIVGKATIAGFLSPTFSFRSFMVTVLMFKFWIPFQVNHCEWYKIGVQFLIVLRVFSLAFPSNWASSVICWNVILFLGYGRSHRGAWLPPVVGSRGCCSRGWASHCSGFLLWEYRLEAQGLQ